MRIRDAGDAAFLLESSQPAALAQALMAAPRPTGLVEVVPGLGSVLVCFDPLDADRDGLEAWARGVAVDASARAEGRLWRIPTRYDGPDLTEVASLAGISRDDVIALHSGVTYRVLVLGFQPGFAYMGELPEALRLPRLAEPRLKVPAGSVAIADAMTAIYPWESPGGWRLLGRTDTALFDVARQPPALLAAGDRVEFVPL